LQYPLNIRKDLIVTLNRRDFALSTAAALGALAMNPTFAADAGVNRRWLLASRPLGKPTRENFRFDETKIPKIKDGEVLLQTLYLSLDPYMRGRMNAGESYAARVELGMVMVGGTISRVAQSRNPAFKVGDMVSSYAGWQDYVASDGKGLRKLDPRITQPSYALGVLGMPGLTAYVGLLDIGQPKPGDTVVLAASTGAVGAQVGQIAKLKGCRVVGIAGAAKKCKYAVEELGYDACVSHYDDDMAEQLAAACPDGIDVYFENVGGSSWEAVMPLLNNHARIPVCGLIAHYNQTSLPPGPDRMSALQGLILTKSIKMQGFIVSDYYNRVPDFIGDMTTWLGQGKIKYKEDMVVGLENAPDAFFGLFSGANFGKLVVQVNT
jgi:NADPH-dependent curcumin reductase CurA